MTPKAAKHLATAIEAFIDAKAEWVESYRQDPDSRHPDADAKLDQQREILVVSLERLAIVRERWTLG